MINEWAMCMHLGKVNGDWTIGPHRTCDSGGVKFESSSKLSPSLLPSLARSHARHVFVAGGGGERAAEGAKAQHQPKLGGAEAAGGRRGRWKSRRPRFVVGTRGGAAAAAVRKAKSLAGNFRARRETRDARSLFAKEGSFMGHA